MIRTTRNCVLFLTLFVTIHSASIIKSSDDFYYDSYNHCCHYHGPTKPPKTFLGNAGLAAFGSGMACVGTLFAVTGISIIVEAIVGKAMTQKEIVDPKNMQRIIKRVVELQGRERIERAMFGSVFSSFGLVFALLGADTLKKSLSRMYKIWHNQPLPEDLEAKV